MLRYFLALIRAFCMPIWYRDSALAISFISERWIIVHLFLPVWPSVWKVSALKDNFAMRFLVERKMGVSKKKFHEVHVW